jgi:hypothetical protein
VSGQPYPKDKQVASERGRSFRHKATWAEKQKLYREKAAPCRICGHALVQLHHLIRRSQGGDDVADNLVPLCLLCHGELHRDDGTTARRLMARLTPAELAYMRSRR